MPANAAIAGSFGAVKDAVELYMGLRQKSIENQRADAVETRAGKALAIQQQRANLDAQQILGQEEDDDVKKYQWLISNFGDTVAQPQDADRMRELGLGTALQHEDPLQATAPSAPIAPMSGMASPMTQPQNLSHPEQDTILPTNSEKGRIAVQNILSRQSNVQNQINSRERISAAQIAARAAQIKNTNQFRQASIAQGWARIAQGEDRMAMQQAAQELGADNQSFMQALALARIDDRRNPYAGTLGALTGSDQFGEFNPLPEVPVRRPPSAPGRFRIE